MARTQIVVVYAATALTALRTIVIDDDSEIPQIQARLAPGEALLTIARNLLPPHPTLPGEVFNPLEITLPVIQQAHGLSINVPPRCVLVDANNNVVDTLIAEPTLYTVPTITTPAMTGRVTSVNVGLMSPVTPTPPFTVVAHASADVGDSLVGGIVTPLPIKTQVVGP